MKRKLVCLFLAICLLASLSVTAYAVTFTPTTTVQDMSSYITYDNHKDGTITVHLPDLTHTAYGSYPLGYYCDVDTAPLDAFSPLVGASVPSYAFSAFSLTTEKNIPLTLDETHPTTWALLLFNADDAVGENCSWLVAVGGFVNPTKVTYDLNGGTVNGSDASKAEWLANGDALQTTFDEPVKNGAEFLGWFTASEGGSKVTASNGSAMTVYAHYGHVHSWEINQENAKGTATCSCGAEVTLTATSATTAKTVGECVEVLSNVEGISKENVQIKKLGEAGTEAQIVDASCKDEGNYQAWLKLDDTHGLYANFTLTNPTTTAATGDNRPIELLFAGFAAVSVMAAAAFTVDRKRR